MGEQTMQLIEQNVKHNVEDIREVKKRLSRVEGEVNDLKANHQVSQQTMAHVMDTLNDLKGNFKILDDKIQSSNNEQLKQYKTAVWQVGITIIATIVGAGLLVVFGL